MDTAQLSLLLGACWLCALCLFVGLLLVGGRRPRHGGYVDLRRASSCTNQPTALAHPTSTGCKPVGLRLADTDGQATPPPPNSDTGPGCSTDGRSVSTATAGYPGPLEATAGSDHDGEHQMHSVQSVHREGREWWYVLCTCGYRTAGWSTQDRAAAAWRNHVYLCESGTLLASRRLAP